MKVDGYFALLHTHIHTHTHTKWGKEFDFCDDFRRNGRATWFYHKFSGWMPRGQIPSLIFLPTILQNSKIVRSIEHGSDGIGARIFQVIPRTNSKKKKINQFKWINSIELEAIRSSWSNLNQWIKIPQQVQKRPFKRKTYALILSNFNISTKLLLLKDSHYPM